MSVWGPPLNLRLVVVDTETTLEMTSGKKRVVAIGLVVCSGASGILSKQTSWLVNPGCLIDPKSQEIHHITVADVASESSFERVWPEVAAFLRPKKGETLVVVAHNAPFDLPVLRDEIARTGAKPALPDLPVLDTMRGLLDASGVEVEKRGLVAVTAALGVPFSEKEHHDALADAVATAKVAKILLDRSVANGHADIAAILAAASGGRTSTVKAQSTPGDPESEEPEALVVPNAHLALHEADWPANPTAAARARWVSTFSACATLRCPEMGAPDGIPDSEKRRLLFEVLTAAAGRRDATATATTLGVLAPMFGTLPDNIADLRVEVGASLPRITGKKGTRGVALVLWAHLESLLASVDRCPEDRPCPSCRVGEPCPRDTWHLSIAEFVLPEPDEKTATAFWNPSGMGREERGKGSGRGWTAMRADAPPLADAVMRRVLAFYRADEKLETVDTVVDQVWREGCRDPGVVASHATMTASGGRPLDLEAAIAECREVLVHRQGNTDRAWEHLAVVRVMLDGRLARALVPPVARHAPADPKRAARQPRFLRAVAT